MRLYANQLKSNLDNGLKPFYLLVGDEPLQLQESMDSVRDKAKQEGYTEREVLQVDQHFSWHELSHSAETMSLFAEKKVVELFMPSGKPGRAGSSAIIDFIKRKPVDVVLIIRCDDWSAANDKAKWVKAIENSGVIVRVYLPKPQEFPRWVQQRCQQIGLSVDNDVLRALALRLEGNLLAAAQELEKLKMRFGNDALDIHSIKGLVADNARFDVFRLTDSLLEGNSKRAIRITRSLRKNELAETLILWALHRETSMLTDLSLKRSVQQNIQPADYRKYGIWKNRQAMVQSVLNRLNLKHLESCLSGLSELDKIIKGRCAGNFWLSLERWLIHFNQPEVMAV